MAGQDCALSVYDAFITDPHLTGPAMYNPAFVNLDPRANLEQFQS